MKFTLKRTLAAIILVLSFAAPVAAGPLEDATAAYVGLGDLEVNEERGRR
jgi:hypothetical protein